jgi:hypothetical protein
MMIDEYHRTYASAQSARVHFLSRGCQCSVITGSRGAYTFTRTALAEEV